MRSLTVKLILILLFTSLVGVVLIGAVARQTTISEFDRFRQEADLANFAEEAETYYATYHAWNGFGEPPRREQPPGPPNSPGRRGPPRMFAIVNQNGVVMQPGGGLHPGEQIDAEQLEHGTAITVNDEVVGIIVSSGNLPERDPREEEYLDRTNQALLIGTGGASIIALLVGIILARYFMRPLRELTAAIRAMNVGELRQEVPVRTNDELGELTRAFNQMSAELDHANQLRRQMTADIAHDLRTPLTVITGYLEGLQDGTLKPTRARFDTMFAEATQLQRLIDDLRTLSLADAGELKLNRQSIAPDELLRDVQASFQPLADESEITLSVEADASIPPVRLDRERMIRLFANLVSNALRHTPAGGQIILAANCDAAQMKLSVRDTGSGIPADKLPHIFDRFYRGDDSRYQTDGESGLGLAIARAIVEAHGGKISARSVMEQGTIIEISLPLQRA